MKHPVTIREVAAAAGVSISTASKAMNGRTGMSEETRHRIIEAAKAVGFHRNDLAHALHRGTSRTVGIISNDNFGRFTMPIAAGIEERLASEQISVFLCNATEDPDVERRHIAQLLAKRVDGLIFTARRLDKRPAPALEDLRVPAIYAFTKGGGRALSVIPDDAQGAGLAVEHLVACGRRRIAYISGPQHFEAVLLRKAGYEKALRAHGLIYSACSFGRWSEASGYAMTQALLASGNRPDAIFCGSDQIARGALDCLRENGISVPGEVAVVGFDNWDVMAEAARPPLTTIDMNLKELGRTVGSFLLQILNREKLEGIHHVPCSLAIRQTTPLIPQGAR